MGVVLQCYGLYREHMPAIDFRNLYDKNATDDIYKVLVAYLTSDIKEVFEGENNDLTLIKESFLLNSLPELLELIVSTKQPDDSNLRKDVVNILTSFKALISPKVNDADNDESKNNNKEDGDEDEEVKNNNKEEQDFIETYSR